MKKLISGISGLAISAFAFLGFLLPVLVFTVKSALASASESASGYDFISFEVLEVGSDVAKNLNTIQIVFSVIAVLFFVVAGLLAIVSVLKFFMNSKKVNFDLIQSILAIALSVLAILLLVMVIAYTMTFPGADNMFYSLGAGMILIPIVTLIGSALIVVFNGKK